MGVLLLREDNLTLDKAEELVKLQETTLQMMQGRGINTKVSHVGQAEGCNMEGHWGRSCPQRRTQEEAWGVTPRSDPRGNRDFEQPWQDTDSGRELVGPGRDLHRGSDRRILGDGPGQRAENSNAGRKLNFGAKREDESKQNRGGSTGVVKRGNTLNYISPSSRPQLGGEPRGSNRGRGLVYKGNQSFNKPGRRFDRMISDVRTVEVMDVPHIVVLLINGIGKPCRYRGSSIAHPEK